MVNEPKQENNEDKKDQEIKADSGSDQAGKKVEPVKAEGKAPKAKAPETKAPEAKAPEAKAPETKAPEAKAPEAKAPEKKMPEKRTHGRKSFNQGRPKENPEFDDHVVKISRVAKVVKGGKNFSFSAVVVSGNGKGKVGVGHGKSNEISDAIRKSEVDAKRNLIQVNVKGDTIPHEIIGKFKSSMVIMKPAGPGTGVIAGGPVRAMCDVVGIKNILTKSLGSRNPVNVTKATINGLKGLRLKRRGQA